MLDKIKVWFAIVAFIKSGLVFISCTRSTSSPSSIQLFDTISVASLRKILAAGILFQVGNFGGHVLLIWSLVPWYFVLGSVLVMITILANTVAIVSTYHSLEDMSLRHSLISKATSIGQAIISFVFAVVATIQHFAVQNSNVTSFPLFINATVFVASIANIFLSFLLADLGYAVTTTFQQI